METGSCGRRKLSKKIGSLIHLLSLIILQVYLIVPSPEASSSNSYQQNKQSLNSNYYYGAPLSSTKESVWTPITNRVYVPRLEAGTEGAEDGNEKDDRDSDPHRSSPWPTSHQPPPPPPPPPTSHFQSASNNNKRLSMGVVGPGVRSSAPIVSSTAVYSDNHNNNYLMRGKDQMLMERVEPKYLPLSSQQQQQPQPHLLPSGPNPNYSSNNNKKTQQQQPPHRRGGNTRKIIPSLFLQKVARKVFFPDRRVDKRDPHRQSMSGSSGAGSISGAPFQNNNNKLFFPPPIKMPVHRKSSSSSPPHTSSRLPKNQPLICAFRTESVGWYGERCIHT